MTDFKHIDDMYCPCCGKLSMYTDKDEKPDYYEGTGVYCKSCGAGGYVNMCLTLGKAHREALSKQSPTENAPA